MNLPYKISIIGYEAIDITDNLRAKYPNHLKENILSVKIVQPENRVWLEVTSEDVHEDLTLDSKVRVDQIIIRTDLCYIFCDINPFFDIKDPIQINAKKFVEDYDAYSIINSTDLFKDEYAVEINRNHHLHKMQLNKINGENLTLTSEFFGKYSKLREFNRGWTPPRNRRVFWRLNNKEISKFLNAGSDGVDFLWTAIIFNLFSKIVYNFSPENYKYYNDFVEWKYGKPDIYLAPDILNKIYYGTFKNFIDDQFDSLPQEVNEKFYNYSNKKINDYSQFLISLFEFFNNECCELNYKKILNENINNKYFKEEFSQFENHLSYKFFESLKLIIKI